MARLGQRRKAQQRHRAASSPIAASTQIERDLSESQMSGVVSVMPMLNPKTYLQGKVNLAKARVKSWFSATTGARVPQTTSTQAAVATAAASPTKTRRKLGVYGRYGRRLWNKLPTGGKWAAGIGVGVLALGAMSLMHHRRDRRDY